MPFVLKKYHFEIPQKIQFLLQNELGFERSIIQRMISKGRVFDENGIALIYGQIPIGKEIHIAIFEGISRGLKPIFTCDDFAIFDKPSGLMVHPVSRKTDYSLLDEIRFHFGEDANLAHRIDQETSGLVLIVRNKESDVALKEMFIEKNYNKCYLALAKGKIDNEIVVDSPIGKENGAIGVRMKVCPDGKESLTIIKPIKYDKQTDQTLVVANPETGRQHQIRVHLHSIGHTIVGDPIYGVDDHVADSYLCKTLSESERKEIVGHDRLMLHASSLEFSYKDIHYKFVSKQNFC
ncbi:MAG: RluA family pseudouridine synthase [Arcobacteraceae bacterium]